MKSLLRSDITEGFVSHQIIISQKTNPGVIMRFKINILRTS